VRPDATADAGPNLYVRGLDATLEGAGLPYGYTIAVWSSATSVLRSHGTPSVGLIFLFAAGAAAAYGMLRVLADNARATSQVQLGKSPHTIRAGAIHLAAIGLAIGSAALWGLVGSNVAWPLASFSATLVYVGTASIEAALLQRSG